MSIFLVILIALYFAPTIIGLSRGHNNMPPIVVVNTFLGWTLIGWVVALAWAFSNSNVKPAAVRSMSAPPAGRPCPHCAETIKAEAKVCRYCGRDVEPVVAASAEPTDAYLG